MSEMIFIPKLKCKCGATPMSKDLELWFGKPFAIFGCVNPTCSEYAKPWLMQLMTHRVVVADSVQFGDQK